MAGHATQEQGAVRSQREPTREYLVCVEREEEMSRLRNQAKMRKPLLVFGPEGVGKSRLLRTFVESQPLTLYVEQMQSPRQFLLAMLHALNAADAGIEVPNKIEALSSSSLKGIVHRALDARPFLMVLDHLDAPSRVIAGMVKDLHYYRTHARHLCIPVAAYGRYWRTTSTVREQVGTPGTKELA